MSSRKAYTFWIDRELDAALKALKARDGVPVSESIRRALAEYVADKGVLETVKAAPRRVSPRRKA